MKRQLNPVITIVIVVAAVAIAVVLFMRALQPKRAPRGFVAGMGVMDPSARGSRRGASRSATSGSRAGTPARQPGRAGR